MKSHFFGYIFAVLTIGFALPAQSVFFGVCCPECKEPQQIEIKGSDCECVCPNDADPISGSDGNIICCDGATNVSTGEIDQACCESNAGGKFVEASEQGDTGNACCKEGSSKDINGSLNGTCCRAAGGRINNGKCCRQAPQGS